jgi:hypothetical protein
MKVSELRIGNLLRDKVTKTELRVIKLTEQDIVTHVIDRSMFPLQDGWGIEPIPLTEERLLKFGFEKSGLWTYVIELQGNLKLVYYLGEKGWSIGFKSYSDFSNLYYVHQLQNLYFALTGEELKQQEQ